MKTMIWEILAMITLFVLAVLLAVGIPIYIYTITLLLGWSFIYQEKRHWCITSGVLIGLLLIAWAVFSISTVKIKYLEKEQYMRLQNFKCSECGTILETHDKDGMIVVKPCESCKPVKIYNDMETVITEE